MIPKTRYAKSGGVSIAYQVSGGDGAVDLIWAPSTVTHLDLDWEYPDTARFIQRLSAFSRVIRFDKRGTGLSDRPTEAATLEERSDDFRAVMDAVGSAQAFVMGGSEGANMACLFAAMHPDRTRGLIVWGGQARWVQSDDYPWGVPREEQERLIAELSEHGVSDDWLTWFGSEELDEVTLGSDRRYYQAAASPGAIAALERMNMDIDIRDLLPTIRTPTLVMRREDDPVTDYEAVRALADAIPSARFVQFPGRSHSMIRPDPEPVLAEIEEFVTGTRYAVDRTRMLATILFTDIVGSSRRASEVGDRRWAEILEGHHRTVRAELQRFGGREVDTAGDGFFATFDGPARAVRCALAIVQNVQELGIEIRAGVHIGEVEIGGEKIAGIAVTIGSRIAALATASEVLVSRTVKDLVIGSGLAFEERGVKTLKGVPDEWPIYAVIGDR